MISICGWRSFEKWISNIKYNVTPFLHWKRHVDHNLKKDDTAFVKNKALWFLLLIQFFGHLISIVFGWLGFLSTAVTVDVDNGRYTIFYSKKIYGTNYDEDDSYWAYVKE